MCSQNYFWKKKFVSIVIQCKKKSNKLLLESKPKTLQISHFCNHQQLLSVRVGILVEKVNISSLTLTHTTHFGVEKSEIRPGVVSLCVWNGHVAMATMIWKKKNLSGKLCVIFYREKCVCAHSDWKGTRTGRLRCPLNAVGANITL